MSKKDQILKELSRLARANRGLVQPSAVVAFARDPKTALHSQFTWDNTVAAEQYRLWQARHLLRVYVTVVPNHHEPVIAHVSLMSDRRADGGYRQIRAVLEDAEMRAELLETAMHELTVFRNRYASLKELCDVFAAIDKVASRKRRKTG